MRVLGFLFLGYLTLFTFKHGRFAFVSFVAAGWVIWYLSGKFKELMQRIHEMQHEVAAQGPEILGHNERLLKVQALLKAYDGDVEQLLKDIDVVKNAERGSS